MPEDFARVTDCDRDLADDVFHACVPVYDQFLFTISYIDVHLSKLRTPAIIEAPYTTNPLVLLSSIIYLHCRSTSSTIISDAGTIFEVHKAKICLRSLHFFAPALAYPYKLLYDTDTDEKTLQRVVNWIHYPNIIDLQEYSTGLLLRVVVIATMVSIPKLHNLVVQTPFRRHASNKEAFNLSQFIQRELIRAIEPRDKVSNLISYLSFHDKDEKEVVVEDFFVDGVGKYRLGRLHGFVLNSLIVRRTRKMKRTTTMRVYSLTQRKQSFRMNKSVPPHRMPSKLLQRRVWNWSYIQDWLYN
jgi:hypothetical protein